MDVIQRVINSLSGAVDDVLCSGNPNGLLSSGVDMDVGDNYSFDEEKRRVRTSKKYKKMFSKRELRLKFRPEFQANEVLQCYLCCFLMYCIWRLVVVVSAVRQQTCHRVCRWIGRSYYCVWITGCFGLFCEAVEICSTCEWNLCNSFQLSAKVMCLKAGTDLYHTILVVNDLNGKKWDENSNSSRQPHIIRKLRR